MASINLSENLLVICSSQHINLFERQDSLNYSFLSTIDITTIEVNLKGNKKKKTDQDKICFLNNETVLVSNRFGSLFKFEIFESKISEGVELLGHFSMLLDFCISPNGKLVLTADRDEKIRISRFPQAYVIEGFCGCKVSETAIRKVGVVEIFEEEMSKEGIICLPDQSNLILLFSLNDQQQMTKLCSFNCSNENEYIFDFAVDMDRKTVFCVGRQGIYYFQPTTINLSSTAISELKLLQFSPPLNNSLLNELNLCEDQLPLNSLYKIPLNGKNIEDYKNRKEEKLGEKKKKLKEEEEN
uniref:Uncharacterized protein n=1 Tax=Meloidogyne javanica TaxID=6303 RepID=A0A915LEH8_MELJA